MKLNDWLTTSVRQLHEAHVETARLDCLVLLEDCLHVNRALLLAWPETLISDAQLSILSSQLSRRITHEPLSYIRGHVEFYGRSFCINRHVLVPRPESEMIIEQLLRLAPQLDTPFSCIDVGTGSGALLITAGAELPKQSIKSLIALDIDEQCLAACCRNATALHQVVEVYRSDLLQYLLDLSYDFTSAVLLCNLPYVPEDFAINKAAAHEPSLALFAGKDGLSLYRRLFAQITQAVVAKPPWIITESFPSQHAAMTALAAIADYDLDETHDFIQVFRLL